MANKVNDNMKSDAFDNTYFDPKVGSSTYSYTNNGLQSVTSGYSHVIQDHKIVEKVEVLIKALGTMVLINDYHINPSTLKKEFLGAVQQPILLDEKRELALQKLAELIAKF